MTTCEVGGEPTRTDPPECHPALWPRPWSSDPRLDQSNVERARQRYWISPLTGENDPELWRRLLAALGPEKLLDTRVMWAPSRAQEIRDQWVAEQLAAGG